MKHHKPRSHKATRWASACALVLAFALSGTVAAKTPDPAAKKSVTSQVADRKKAGASKVAVRKVTLVNKKALRKARAPVKSVVRRSKQAVAVKAPTLPSKATPRTAPGNGQKNLRPLALNNAPVPFAAQRPGIADNVSKPALAASLLAPASTLSAAEHPPVREIDVALDLSSSVALVVDQDTNEVLLSKNDSAVLPIASLTKLMTGLVIADANLPMDEIITITQDDVDTYKGSRSRLAVGSQLTRGELMHLALMSSENRAAHALGRTFPGGLDHFVSLMNSKARALGMRDTRYVEPTGLLSQNQSSARDLATLVSVAYQRPILRDLSTSPSHQLALGHRTLQFNNSNRLIQNPDWEIGLQKTGYIAEAGRCLVMQAKVAGRKVIMVFLNSAGKLSRLQDAERVRRWVESQTIQSTFVRPQG